MFNHIMIGTNDMARSKRFYDALIGAMGGAPGTTDKLGRTIYAHRGGRLMVSAPIDGAPATGANGGTIGFAAASQPEAEAWHRAGVENGGTSIEDAPGLRDNGVYLGYLRDPDGNKLCVVHRPAA